MIDFIVRGKPKSLGSGSKKRWQANPPPVLAAELRAPQGEFVFIQVAEARTQLEFL